MGGHFVWKDIGLSSGLLRFILNGYCGCYILKKKKIIKVEGGGWRVEGGGWRVVFKSIGLFHKKRTILLNKSSK